MKMNDKIWRVKKLLFIFMLVLLPLQVSWAAVAVYCQHEQGQSAHFGHHNHEHQAQLNDQSTDSSDKEKLSPVDSDCVVCHLFAQQSFLNSLPTVTPPKGEAHLSPLPAYYSSHIPDGPQKPDWQLVA